MGYRHAITRVAQSILFCLVLALLLAGLDFVMTPSVGTLNGWAASRQAGDVDVLAFGSSRTYCTILPMEMWRESGITALDITSAIQVVPVTAAYVEQALKTQHPKVVMVELYMVGKRSTFDITTAHKSLDYMPAGLPRARSVLSSVSPANWFEAFLPLQLYHSRWSQLNRQDFLLEKHTRYAYGRGAMYLPDASVVTTAPLFDVVSEDAYLMDLPYLRDIARYCDEAGATLVLFTSPSPYRIMVGNQQLLERLRADLSASPGIEYLDLNEAVSVAGIDAGADYKDDLHLNNRGAVKMSRWLGHTLAERFALQDRRSETLATRWDADLAKYDEVFLAEW